MKFSKAHFSASGFESKDNNLQPFFANETEKGATPAKASNTNSPS